jgi:hypothetical protein
MRRLLLCVCAGALLTGCGTSGLTALAKTETRYLEGLQLTMPDLVTAHDAALKGFLNRAETAEEEALSGDRAEALKGVLDDAMRTAGLNASQPTRDSVRDTLRTLLKSDRDQAALAQAARAAGDLKAAALMKALADLGAAVPTLVTQQRTIENYLEAQHGLIPLGGVSLTEPPRSVEDLVTRLKTIGSVLDEQFGRADAIFESARKAVTEGEKR